MTPFAAFMHGGGWATITLASAVFSAAVYLLNQYMKQPGHMLVFWSRIATVLALAPFARHIAMPTNPLFYAAVVATAFSGGLADIRTFNVAARFGGGIIARVQPLTVFLTFLLWFAFEPSLFRQYAQTPVNTGFVLLAMGGCGYFASRLRKCAVSRRALLDMAPALLGYTVSTVLNKFAMTHAALAGAVFAYMYVQSAVVVVLAGGYILLRQKQKDPAPLWTRKMALTAPLLALGWICSMVLKNSAMAFVPNPAYLAALLCVTPVLIALFYKLAGHREEADVLSGMGVVACAALLALVTV